MQSYRDAMTYFVAFALLIFLGVMFYLGYIRYFISPRYFSGLKVVPLIMLGELFFGIFYNLSVWYKLTDRTQWGMYFSLLCFALMLGLNFWLVRAIGIPDGYMGAAWAAFISYFTVMVVSYFVGRHYYPLPYQVGRIGGYVFFAAALYWAGNLVEWPDRMWLTYILRAIMLAVYVGAVGCLENVPLLSPALRRLLRR